jgi:hypothetical protein
MVIKMKTVYSITLNVENSVNPITIATEDEGLSGTLAQLEAGIKTGDITIRFPASDE